MQNEELRHQMIQSNMIPVFCRASHIFCVLPLRQEAAGGDCNPFAVLFDRIKFCKHCHCLACRQVAAGWLETPFVPHTTEMNSNAATHWLPCRQAAAG